MEFATSTHVRIAEPFVRFLLPDGRHGIFVGGSETVRVGRIRGVDRMRAMMLTVRSYSRDDGVALGLAHYAVEENEALRTARKLARKIADNAPFSNQLMLQALPRINDISSTDSLYTESVAAAMSQTSDGANEGLRAFLKKHEPTFC